MQFDAQSASQWRVAEKSIQAGRCETRTASDPRGTIIRCQNTDYVKNLGSGLHYQNLGQDGAIWLVG